MSRIILREFKTHTMRGDFPDVPLYAHVDKDLLYKGDDDPLHIVLEISRIGEMSQSGMLHDAALVTELEKQLPGLGGMRGHLKQDERDTAFPLEDIDWVGHQRVGDSLWAKGYIPPGQTRDYVRRVKARNGKLATSIYGPADARKWIEKGKTWTPVGFRLEQVDLAPARRASLDLGGAFTLTQMNDEEDGMGEGTGDQELIAELRTDRTTLNLLVSELKLDGDKLAAAKLLVSEMADLRKHKTTLDEIISEMGLDAEKPVAAAKTIVAELTGHRRAALVAEVDVVIAELTKENELIRPFIREYVIGKDVQGRESAAHATKDEAKARLEALLASDHIKALAQTLVSEQRGPNAFIRRRETGDDGGKPDTSPEAVQRDRAWAGW